MKVKFSYHANKRMREDRQKGIDKGDVIYAARSFMPNSKIAVDMKIQNMRAKSGRRFDVVVAEKKNFRLIVTVVGC
jgi:hypothetical protein